MSNYKTVFGRVYFYILIFFIATGNNVVALPVEFHDFRQIMKYAVEHSGSVKNLSEESHLNQMIFEANQDVYDSSLDLKYGMVNKRNPTIISFEASKVKTHEYDLELTQELPLGVESTISTGMDEVTTTQTQLYEYDRVFVEMGVKVDLLRNILGRIDKSIIHTSKLQQEIEEITYKNKIDKFLFEVANDALLLLQQQDLIKFQKIRCNNLLSLYEINNRKYQRRVIELQNYLLSKLEHKNCLQTLSELTIDQKILQNKLIYNIATLDTSPEDEMSLSDNIMWPKDDIVVMENNIEQNDQLRIAKLAIQESYETYLQAKFSKYPDVELSGDVSNKAQRIDGSDVGGIGDYDYPSYSVNLSVNIPIGNKKAKLLYKKSAMEMNLQKKKYLELENIVKADYANTKYEIEKYTKLLASQKEEIEIREKIYQERNRDFLVGRISTGEIIDTQDDLTNALQTMTKIKFSMFFFQLKYLFLTGEIQGYYD